MLDPTAPAERHDPMADAGDPPPPVTEDDPDAEVGFTSAEAVRGRPVAPPAEPPAAREPDPEPDGLPTWAAPRPTEPEPTPLDEVTGEQIAPAVAIYALIVAAAPTGGLSAVVGLWLAWTRRDEPSDWLASHYIYQLRTLATAAVLALAGLILVAISLGVFVLFAVALWMLVRAAFGATRLMRGRPIDNPRSWFL